MKEEVKAKWIADLRSGKFPQTRATMHRPVANDAGPAGYCCLGVLAQQFVDSGEIVENRGILGEGISMYQYPDGVMFGVGKLTPEARDKVGFNVQDQMKLIQMNDDGDSSFESIADWIEENVR